MIYFLCIPERQHSRQHAQRQNQASRRLQAARQTGRRMGPRGGVAGMKTCDFGTKSDEPERKERIHWEKQLMSRERESVTRTYVEKTNLCV